MKISSNLTIINFYQRIYKKRNVDFSIQYKSYAYLAYTRVSDKTHYYYLFNEYTRTIEMEKSLTYAACLKD
jgi:hypothetical protein